MGEWRRNVCGKSIGREGGQSDAIILTVVVFLLAFLAPGGIYGQQEWRFERYSIAEGLSQSIVECIIQDQAGYMWFGTEDGLNRFDGYTFTVLRPVPGDGNSLSFGNITTLLQDRKGRIWIGTFNAGVNVYDPRTRQFIRFTSRAGDLVSLSHNMIRAIYEDHEGAIWIGTDGGLSRFRPETKDFLVFRHDSRQSASLSHDLIYAIFEDRRHDLWVGTGGGGLNRFQRDSQAFIHYRRQPAGSACLSSDDVRAIAEDHDGWLWIGTAGGGLNRLDPERQINEIFRHDPNRPDSLSHDQVYDLLVDRGGRLWVGTNGGGLNIFDPVKKTFIWIKNDPGNLKSLSLNEIHALYEDRSGMIWVGTYGGGICLVNGQPKAFSTIRSIEGNPNSLSEPIVWAIYKDERDILWFGTHGGGIDLFDRLNNQWSHYRHQPDHPNSLSNDRVRVIYRDRQRIYWIGTNGGGVNRLDREKELFTRYCHDPDNDNSLSYDEIRAISQDRFNIIWIGTHGGGLNSFDSQTQAFTRYRFNPQDAGSIGSDIIRDIHEDHVGRLWIGTYGGGINLFDRTQKKFIRYQADLHRQDWLRNNYIFSIYEDRQGILWLGTWGGGLVRFDPQYEYFRHFTVASGLPSDSIYGVIADDDGYLWLSSNNGLSRFNPREDTFQNYREGDGLQSNEFNGGAFFRAGDGELFFGGINGVNSFYPRQIKSNSHVPPVVITSLKVLNRETRLPRPVMEMDELVFAPRDYFFSFEFAALDFTNSEKNQYAYKLEGFDPTWIYTDAKQRIATYTKLAPGHYRFLVRGSNNDGLWNEKGSAIAIVIAPSFWQTWWFKGLIVFAFLLSTLLFYLRHLENVRLKTELNSARLTQMSIMPQCDPVIPGVQVSGMCLPANEIGGDFFDYYWLDEKKSHFGVVIADVSGKAMKAAMTALLTSGMVLAKIDDALQSVDEIMTHLNRTLYLKTEKNMFTALCLAVLDLPAKTLSFVNAGLNDLVIKNKDQVQVVRGEGPRLPMGVNRTSRYVEKTIPLRAGDVILIFTDGLTDVQNSEEKFLSFEGLVDILKQTDTDVLSAHAIKEQIIRRVRHFAGGVHHADDIALVVIKVTA